MSSRPAPAMLSRSVGRFSSASLVSRLMSRRCRAEADGETEPEAGKRTRWEKAQSARGVANREKVVIVTGPTAVGKTALSLRLAEALGGEVISADSVQVYRGLDVGSDKLPVHERGGIPHHLIDVLDAEEDFSAGDFFPRARAAIADVLSRGRVPLVVGGTGFYLHWLINGPAGTGRSDAEGAAAAQALLDEATSKAEVAAGRPLSAEERWDAGRAVLAELGDPGSAERMRACPNNWYRLRRAVEVVRATGRPMEDAAIDASADLDYDFRCFFLHRPRVDLFRRIDRRCEEMVAGGLLEECTGLLRRGVRANTHCCSRAIGYRQGLDHLERWVRGSVPVDGAALRALCTDIQAPTRTLVRRQHTWFRGYALFRWVDASRDQDAVVEEVLGQVAGPYVEGGNSAAFDNTPEEQQALKRNVTRWEVLRDGSEELEGAVARANAAVTALRGDAGVMQTLAAVAAAPESGVVKE